MDVKRAGGLVTNGVGGGDGHCGVADREKSPGSLGVTQSRRRAAIARGGGWVVHYRSGRAGGIGVLVWRTRSDRWCQSILNDDGLGLDGGIAVAIIIGPA